MNIDKLKKKKKNYSEYLKIIYWEPNEYFR